MSIYVNIDGQKYVQLDDGVLVPVQVFLPCNPGIQGKLPPTQMQALAAPNSPASYLRPSDQVEEIRQQDWNPPTAISLTGIPAALSSNHPDAFALPLGQEAVVAGVEATIDNFATGAAGSDANTLRGVIAQNSTVPRRSQGYTIQSFSIDGSLVGGWTTLVAPATGRSLLIAEIVIGAAGAFNMPLHFRLGAVTPAEAVTVLSGAIAGVKSANFTFHRPVLLPVNQALKIFFIFDAPVFVANGHVAFLEVIA